MKRQVQKAKEKHEKQEKQLPNQDMLLKLMALMGNKPGAQPSMDPAKFLEQQEQKAAREGEIRKMKLQEKQVKSDNAAANQQHKVDIAKMAVEETGMGVVEDKVIKNNYAAEYIYNAYKNTKTCGVIEEDKAFGIKKIAEPIGVVAAVIPTTNPTSTAIFKTMIALKTRNGIIISPHPRAKNATIAAA